MIRGVSLFLFYALMCLPIGTRTPLPLTSALLVVFHSHRPHTGGIDTPWLLPESMLGPKKIKLRNPQGLVCTLFGRAAQSPAVARAVVVLTRAALLCAAVGIGGAAARIAAAAGWFMLTGVLSELRPPRKYILPSFTLLVMAFSTSHDPPSLSRCLAYQWPWSAPAQAPVDFAPAITYYYLSWTLIGSVSAKLRRNPHWGGSLRGVLQRKHRAPRLPLMKQLLVNSPALCMLLGYTTLLVELGSVVGNFEETLKPVFLIGMVMLHIGVATVLSPLFFHQALCYLVMVDWEDVLGLGKAVRVDEFKGLAHETQLRFFVGISILTVVMLLTTVIRPREYFPFSEFGYYASYPTVLTGANQDLAPGQTSITGLYASNSNCAVSKGEGRGSKGIGIAKGKCKAVGKGKGKGKGTGEGKGILTKQTKANECSKSL